MHFTLWPSRTSSEGGHTEVDWPTFVDFVRNPTIAQEKNALEGWSPARFTGNRRARAACEFVSCIVLDDDKSGLTLPALLSMWGDVAGIVHSSHSSTPTSPKWRIVLRCTRDMTPAEHAVVWSAVRDVARARGQTIDEATKDPSRLWFVPAVKPGAEYECAALTGEPLDVDEVLRCSTTAASSTISTPSKAASASSSTGTASSSGASNTAGDRRRALAAALAAAWPAKGRHEAQLALAGALRAEGFTETEAVEFLCDVCRMAGNEDRAKREATVRHTYGKPADAALTGWTRLKSFVDPVVVDVVRSGVGKGAALNEKIAARLEQYRPSDTNIAPAIVGPEVAAGPFKFKASGLDADLPPIDWQIERYIAQGDVVMFVAHGNSLKTWLAFSVAHSVATGRPWLTKFASKRGRAAILDFESGEYEVARRMKLLGVKDGEVGDRLLRCSYPAAELTDAEHWIVLAGLQPRIVVIDSFNAASPALDENDATAALMLHHAGRFAEHMGCTVLFIHHARKGAGGDRREAVRGSTALFAACDRIFEFTDMEKRDDGAVSTTVRSVKDGAGRAPADVRVELSDQGLRYIDAPPAEATEEATTETKNREIVFEILRNNSAGVPQKRLVEVMKGKREHKFALLGSLVLAGVLVEFESEGKTWLMLNPKNSIVS